MQIFYNRPAIQENKENGRSPTDTYLRRLLQTIRLLLTDNGGWKVLCMVACVLSLVVLSQNEYVVHLIRANQYVNSLQVAVTKQDQKSEKKEYIKWMEFDVPPPVMQKALSYDIASYREETPVNWIELISYCAAKNWGRFPSKVWAKDMEDVVTKLKNGEQITDLTKNMKLYSFYLEAYSAVLGGFVGEFEVEEKDPDNPEKMKVVRKYGVKVFSPVAKNYGYSHYDDFGVSRSYGYKRKHQGNDIMGNVGTPIIAIEDGYVESIGWNQYGGWRVGIRSNDKKRYYYYAHLKKDYPFPKSLVEGSAVKSGDVIGYLGMTGYSSKENVNNIKTPHLHLGMQVIFDESQKDGSNQIWVDMYTIVEFLSKYRMQVYKVEGTKDFIRAVNINNVDID